MVTLLTCINYFIKALKKAIFPSGAASHVEVGGFVAKHYDTLLDLASFGFYQNS
ncbi:MAG: hypothetical protein GWO20_07190 [Candidatus Korarchaeota archaeon]|nr:hypothetical protein [Candidatus Korarchaeota archaeon]NIU83227.1 hypothetical protein [Candidatus Thorarchaeota archaeon]NIW13173.1 hypothetical protein [Candidatus Thorarchaeota archaeon]NIW51314.1 hypothetical protein [Candidatus Korarchaeota archaeon]